MQANIAANATKNILSIAYNCRVTENASEDDVKTLLVGDLPKTRSSKCLHACVQESIGLVSFALHFFSIEFNFEVLTFLYIIQIKDGNVYVEGAIRLGRMIFDDNEEAIKAATEVAHECETVTDSDRCEMAMKLMNCSTHEVKRRNLGVEKLMV